ncbi:uncharacterized protein B0I36DRAFT_385146 [Microdochium trichocladiopsis]|uniref:Uncharacterized protein n=1 Tax=Microdochium trichocladiopsis TaxID=1682393 RepID=A0A9P8Y7F4_9PEZI|nr:uncharacterized protein B0I36DRAFT_385146 [Microdochium trichocladiopsis]KAH7029773.1 hypothetical protein B0I36DRAFT_385146 [Microdochium trichocladiopsis]
MVVIKSVLAIATFGTLAIATANIGDPCGWDPQHPVKTDCGPDGQQSLICQPDNKWHLSHTCPKGESVCPPGGGFCVNPVPYKA